MCSFFFFFNKMWWLYLSDLKGNINDSTILCKILNEFSYKYFHLFFSHRRKVCYQYALGKVAKAPKI